MKQLMSVTLNYLNGDDLLYEEVNRQADQVVGQWASCDWSDVSTDTLQRVALLILLELATGSEAIRELKLIALDQLEVLHISDDRLQALRHALSAYPTVEDYLGELFRALEATPDDLEDLLSPPSRCLIFPRAPQVLIDAYQSLAAQSEVLTDVMSPLTPLSLGDDLVLSVALLDAGRVWFELRRSGHLVVGDFEALIIDGRRTSLKFGEAEMRLSRPQMEALLEGRLEIQLI